MEYGSFPKRCLFLPFAGWFFYRDEETCFAEIEGQLQRTAVAVTLTHLIEKLSSINALPSSSRFAAPLFLACFVA
jgi:hypothetical protein